MHFKVYSKYFYSKLDNSGKKVYDKILEGWLNYSKPQKTQSYEQQKLVVDIVALATDCGIRQGRALMMHCVHLLIPELMWER